MFAESRRAAASFGVALAAIALGALGLRLVYAIAFAPDTSGVEDAFWFSQVARSLSQGDGFTIFSGNVLEGSVQLRATAEHPPLYALILAAAMKLGIGGDEALRSLGALFGAATVVLTGLVGRRVGGPGTGLVAAGITAVYPLLIAVDGALLAETVYAAILAGVLLLALRAIDAPSAGRSAALGAAVGLAVLTRSEAVLLIPLLIAPVAWFARPQLVRNLLVAGVCAALVVSPWVIRNWTTFDRPLLSTNFGGLLVQTNCDAAYYGDQVGWFVPRECPATVRGNEPEGERDARWREQAIDYAGDHAGRVPVVAGVRVLRSWGLWEPFRSVHEQGRDARLMKVGVVGSLLLLPFAVAGGVLMRRRRPELIVLLAPAALAAITAATSYGSMRLRLPADLSLIVLAAVAVVALARRRLSAAGARGSETGPQGHESRRAT